ncbi:C40 family peptidase [Vallitalea guaymasensis]|uniref:C40 family peptidase n=1 Tax=Vallitalea guaymasensis TaxID=1185412 RepID=UPI00272D0C4E|nr:C40 family peptidase [Vallitalea guaymasensis]
MKRRGIKQVTLGILGGLVLTLNVNAATIGVVNVKNLNVRSGPSTTSSIVDHVHLGEKLEIISTSDNWFKIDLDLLSNAYVHSNYVNIENSSNSKVVTTKAELRNSPNLLGNVLATIDKGQLVSIEYQTGDWFYVSTTKGKGYMYKNSLSETKSSDSKSLSTSQDTTEKTSKKVATVNTNILNVRQQPSISSKKIGKVYRNNTFEVLSESEEWVSIKIPNGSTGYIYKDYVVISDEKTITDSSSLRQQVVSYAKQFLGNPYVWGGNSLTKGVDCSGFTQQVMKKFGISISRTSRSQINNGYRVSKNDLLPGDLVFFGYRNRISHVALYIGNNQVIHANNRKTGIIINTLGDSRLLPYIGATRVIK